MNFISSHHNHENRRYEGSPPQGPSRGTAGQSGIFQKYHSWSAGGAPCRGGGNYRNREYGDLKPRILSELIRFS